MNNKKRDFVFEDKFIEWRLLPTDELDKYWEDFRKNNPELSYELDIAIEKFGSLNFDTYTLQEEEKKEILDTIFHKLKKKNHFRTFIQATSTIAAIAIIGLFITLFTNTNNNKSSTENTIIGQTLPEEDVYIISGESKTKLSNNSNLELTKDKKALITDSAKRTKEVVLAEATMNRLVVPYGKRSNITLADGTKVWINSGTQLDFPSEFVGKNREINVNGEIYIEVKEDKKRPFIVTTNKMSVKVYGTAFNVTAYKEEDSNSIVLVEGKVGVKANGNSKESYLQPNEKLDLTVNGMVKKVVDVSEYISWTRDVLEFEETPISEILKKVGRYYNVRFENSPEIALNELTCSGKLFLSNSLDSVMTSISALSSTKYKRENNIIHIKKRNEPMR